MKGRGYKTFNVLDDTIKAVVGFEDVSFGILVIHCLSLCDIRLEGQSLIVLRNNENSGCSAL